MKYLFNFYLLFLFSSCATWFANPVAPTSDSIKEFGTQATKISLSYKDQRGKITQIIGSGNLSRKEKCLFLFEEVFEVNDLKNKSSKRIHNSYQIFLPFIDLETMKIHFLDVERNGGVRVITGSRTQYVLKFNYLPKSNSLIPHTSLTLENGRKDSVKVDLKQSMEIKFSSMKFARAANSFFLRSVSTCN